MSRKVTSSSRWRAVDGDSEEVARYLDTVAQLLQAMKAKSIDMLRLRPGAEVLDVGCGIGRDAEAILEIVGASGRVVGIDAGQELIVKAIERTRDSAVRPEFRVGDALALEFGNDTFDACRSDRLLQHLDDPAGAVAEMVRVTRPGGRVSILDADWHTMAIAGGDINVSQAISRQHAFVATRQGDVGRRLVEFLMDAGCDDVEVDARALWMRNLGAADFVLDIRVNLENAVTTGAVSREAGDAWWDAVVDLDARGRFFASTNGVICAGTVR